jgi:ElaB/YqjD/DUF883 family membrane-anchored ribosome-binding protein
MSNDGRSGADIEALIGSMREDIAKLTEALANAFAAKGAETASAARDAAGRLRQEASGAAESLEHAIEERPIVAVLIALVVGFLAGALLRR